MAIDLKIPHVGESITEVQISEWLKSEGDPVKKDENVAIIDSEKTTFELSAPESGKLGKIIHQAGDTVKIGDVIGHIEPADGPPKPKANAPNPAAKANPETAPAADAEPEPKTPSAGDKISKEGKKSGEPEKADAPRETEPPSDQANEPPANATETDSKKTGLPSRGETQTNPPAGREEKTVPMTMLRRTAARRLVEAKQQMAMLTTFNEVDMSGVLALRKEHQEAFEKRYQTKLGFMSFFVSAAVDALKQFPQISAKISANDIIYPGYFDIGVAIANERGLVVPILRNAERMDFAQMEKAIGDFARRAKDGKLKPEELEGGTFTITNGGVFGSLFSTPIVNPPQSCILGMHTIQERPMAIQGQVVVRPMMYVALTYDHRIVDGREAVLFLRRIKEIIESPARLLIGI